MWLLKKFLHTDIIGKIYILIILFIVVVTIITAVVRTNKAKEQKANNMTVNKVQEISKIDEDYYSNGNLIMTECYIL